MLFNLLTVQSNNLPAAWYNVGNQSEICINWLGSSFLCGNSLLHTKATVRIPPSHGVAFSLNNDLQK